VIFLLVLLPATGLTIAGYFVLYLSSRTEGTLRTFGRYLGFWAFTLAGLLILAALFAAAHFGHHGMFAAHGGYCPWHGEREEAWEDRAGPRHLHRPRAQGMWKPRGLQHPLRTSDLTAAAAR